MPGSIYEEDQALQINENFKDQNAALLELMFRGHSEFEKVTNKYVRKYLSHGVGRRLSVIKRSLEQIFSIFPPELAQPLSRDQVTDVQAYLHSLVINTSGLFDNWVWAFLHQHGLVNAIGRRTSIGITKERTRRYLPPELNEYIEREDISNWHATYLKEYRDSLAHRIPLYVPQANFSPADIEEHRALEQRKADLFATQQWDELDRVWDIQDRLGSPSPVFLFETLENEESLSVYLHPQLINDVATIVEFGNLYYKHWLTPNEQN